MKPIDKAAVEGAHEFGVMPDEMGEEHRDFARGVFESVDTDELAQVIASHQLCRNSTTDDPSGYRVWVTCRCKWISDDIEDPNVPNVELVKARHIAEAVKTHLLEEDA